MSSPVWSVRRAPNGLFSRAHRAHKRHLKRGFTTMACPLCWRCPTTQPWKRGGEDRESLLGLAYLGTSTLAGEGCPASTACKYCDEIDGHTAQCPTVSLGGAS